MKLLASAFLILLLCTSVVKSDVIYLDPIPNSKYVSINNNLIIGTDAVISESSVGNLSIVVTGSKSGIHSGDVILTSDKKRIIFKPYQRFMFDETVTVSITSQSNQIRFNGSKSTQYIFHTEKSKIKWGVEETLRSELGEKYHPLFQTDNPDPPELSILISNNPSPGKILMGSFSPTGSYLLVVENNAALSYAKEQASNSYDFKRHPDGTFTYFSKISEMFYQLDSTFAIIDSFYCGNGYTTDLHEIIFTPTGNVFLMAYDTKIIDMSQIVPGGHPAAQVTGLIIQEIDGNRNVVFQWRSWDHFQITDATHLNFTSANIDYVHGNAIEVDYDGHVLISSRHMDEITKINRSTGQIIWRLGGKNNDFTFINDSIKFSYQHDIRRIANGNITLYDNGNFHTPQFSRAVEYQLNEANRTATLVWQYRSTPDIYGFAMGSARRLPNGNTIIGWGYTSPTLTEVTPQGDIALQMKLPDGALTYRVTKSIFDIPTGIAGTQAEIPNSYELSQNYPNPFNPSTSISFSLPAAGNVSIKVYDVMGREVRTLINGQMQAGTHNTVFEASGLASGVYVYKITAGDYTATKKMVLMK